MGSNDKQSGGKERMEFGFGLGGILKGLGDLVEKLGDIAEKGEELSKAGELDLGGKTKGMKAVYGFTVRTGLGGKGVHVEPFGNVRKDETTGESMVQEIREPMVDIFEEEDHVLVVAEMPGIGAEDIQLDLKDDIMTLRAQKGDKKYRKEILLPGSFERDKMTFSCNNGVVES